MESKIIELLSIKKNNNLGAKEIAGILGEDKEELRKIKKEYTVERITDIKEEEAEIKIDTSLMLPKEDVVVCLTKEGYIKRVPLRSYNSSLGETTGVKEGDYLIGLFNINTVNTILIFTSRGNYIYLPVYEIPELKWKDLGKHISNIVPIESEEKIIGVVAVYDFNDDVYVTSFSKNGMIKRTKLADFKVQRYSKPIAMMNLKDNDEVVDVSCNNDDSVFIATKNGYGLWYSVSAVSLVIIPY